MDEDEDLIEQVSDDEMADNTSSGKKKSSKTHRSGGDVADDEPPLEGYERWVIDPLVPESANISVVSFKTKG